MTQSIKMNLFEASKHHARKELRHEIHQTQTSSFNDQVIWHIPLTRIRRADLSARESRANRATFARVAERPGFPEDATDTSWRRVTQQVTGYLSGTRLILILKSTCCEYAFRIEVRFLFNLVIIPLTNFTISQSINNLSWISQTSFASASGWPELQPFTTLYTYSQT